MFEYCSDAMSESDVWAQEYIIYGYILFRLPRKLGRCAIGVILPAHENDYTTPSACSAGWPCNYANSKPAPGSGEHYTISQELA